MSRKLAPLALALVAVLAAPAALAQSAGSWSVGLGAHNVDPKSDNGSLDTALGVVKLDVGANVRPTITAEYFVADNLGVEVIAALPFQHDIDVVGVGTVGSTKHLPPTVSLNYHFGAPDATVKPYVGAGVNYTWFFSEKTEGVLNGVDLSLKNSWGLAAQAGIDFAIGNGALRLNVRHIDIDTDVSLNGTKVGTASIDPLVYGVHYMMKF
ncbi:MAG: OmpW family outer membrane protein [Pseudoxanthomonas suwonensis]|nr:OmpW family outer membrane protein [Pseudoxanthomonas suwonensis]